MDIANSQTRVNIINRTKDSPFGDKATEVSINVVTIGVVHPTVMKYWALAV
jgi:hypothetical protein